MSEIIGAMYQHEETGQLSFVDQQQIEWGFEKNNPRHKYAYDVYDQKDLLEQNAALKKAGNEMLELLVKNAPIDGLWSSDIDNWDVLLGNRG